MFQEMDPWMKMMKKTRMHSWTHPGGPGLLRKNGEKTVVEVEDLTLSRKNSWICSIKKIRV
jgi:hypothetical protein